MLRRVFDDLVTRAAGRPIALKDPRLSVMMPLWAPILEPAMHPILVVRDPIESARSLCRRDDTPVPFGLAIWESHMARLLNWLDGRVATVARYAALIADRTLASSVVSDAAANLDERLSSVVDPTDAGNAFDVSLYRNVAADGEHEELLTERQAELWRFLGSLTSGSRRIDAPATFKTPSCASEAGVGWETTRAAHHEDAQRADALEDSLARERLKKENLADANAKLTSLLEAQRVRAYEAKHVCATLRSGCRTSKHR